MHAPLEQAKRGQVPSAAIATAVALALIAQPAALRAEGANADTSAWDRAGHSGVRLLSGRAEEKAPTMRAGIEIALDPGWKTYWRYPGDSGVPPRFDFSASDNVADVIVLYPAPQRFADGNGTSIGYSRRVVLPLRVVPRDAAKSVTLRAKIDYAICEKLCVPVEAKVALTLTRASPSAEATLGEHEARVPRRSTLGAAEPLAVVAVKRDDGDKPRVSVDVRADRAVDLFAEGPTAEWSLPLPEPAEGAPGGLKRFSFELDGLPSGASAKGATLLLTAITDTGAIEVPVTLD